MLYKFDLFTLDTDLRELRRGDTAISVEPQVFDLLLLLIENRERVVGKDEIFETVWKGRVVSDATLSSRINALRNALGDDGQRQKTIKTSHGYGFRFVADLKGEARDAESKLGLSIFINRQRWISTAIVSVAISLAAIWVWVQKPNPISVSLHDRPAIAVLPFVNLSDDPEQDYFADGMSEDIMTELSRFGYFFVVSRNSTFSYKGSSTPARQVAHELGVQYVLEGSVRKVDSKIRITAQLIDATSDKHIWAERYDRDFGDVFVVQDEITKNIVSSVAPEYLTAETRRAQKDTDRNLEAWDTFVRGYWHYMRFTRHDNLTAQRLLVQAIELDPRQATYQSILAASYMIDALYGWSDTREVTLQHALQVAERALALDDQDSQVIRVVGLIHFFSKDHDMARHFYERAVASNPLDAENRALFGAALGVAGEYEAAVKEFRTAMRLSPRDMHMATWFNYLAIAAFVDGQDKEAAEWAQKTIRSNPQFPGGYRTLAAASGQLGKIEKAQSAGTKLLELLPHITIAQLRESIPYFQNPEDFERYLSGLRVAGIPE